MTTVQTAVITGIGSCLPERVVKNEEIAERLGVTTDWIRDRTGIEQRYVLDPGSAMSDLAVGAGRRALDAAGVQSVDFLLLATCTPDVPIPGTAPAVASRLGLSGIGAIDLNAACSGFLYALTMGAGMLASGSFTSGLVIGADAMASIVDPNDRTTVPLFADGAGAVVIRAGQPDEPGALRASLLGSEGELAELLYIPAGGSRQRIAGPEYPSGDAFLSMQGRVVYRNAVKRMSEASNAIMQQMGWSVDDVDWLVGHQANRRILDATAEAIGIPAERALVNVDRVANTSSASIPLALATAAAEGTLKPGHRLVLTAFGAGFTWAAAAMIWPDIPVYTDR